MSHFHNNMLLGSAGNQGAYEIERSLRFDSGDTTYLNRTPSSAGDRTEWTWSAWIKRSGFDSTVGLFGSYVANNNTDYLEILFASANTLLVQGNSIAFLNTSQVFRDPSAWYHIVIAVDTSNTTADDRIKIYVNGEQITTFATRNNPGSGVDLGINQAGVHRLGRRPSGTDYFNGYMAEVNFIDGTALDHTSFGETDTDTGAWIPKEYTGSFGTNGFYLDFSDNSDTTATTLGKDSSGNNNNWTPNNFSVPVNPSYPYALSASGGVYDRDKAFDGSTSTFAGTNTSDTITFAPSGGIAYSTSVEFYTSNGGGPGSNDQRYSFNGGSEVNCSGGEYTTVASGSGTLTSLAVRNTFGAPSRLNVIRIDGSILLAEFGTGIDSLEDTPTNNWCTLNPLKKGTITVSQGSLKAVGGADYQAIHGTIGLPSTGKFYWEATVDVTSGAVTDQFVGVAGNNTALTGTSPYPQGDTPALYYVGTGSMTKNGSTVQTGLGTFAADDVIGVAYDADGATVQFYKNGTAVGTAESLPSTTETLFPAYIATTNRFANFNWGQRSFDQTPPTGFEALNTANLPVPTIKDGTEYFNTVLYTGNGSSGQDITTVGFQPDFVWLKKRSGGTARSHQVYDSVRGATKYLHTDDTSAEGTFTNALDAFLPNGFSLAGDNDGANGSTNTYVAWNWEESVDAGFDIVTDTGTGAAKTVSHNLGVAPKMIIRKSRTSSTGHWYVYHYEEGASEAGILQLNNAFAASTAWNSTAPTSSVFSVGSNVDENKLNDNFISYLFAEVDGFSKFGSYVGNGSTDGPFLYCGFSVAYLMVKKASSTENWAIYDNKRGPFNPLDKELFADTNDPEYDGNRYIDFLSNGFKPRANSGTSNLSGQTYVFMAFAKNAFKYANAV